MIILLVALFSVVALLFCIYVVTIKTIQVVGMLTLLALGIAVVAVGCISLIMSLICIALLCQIYGVANIGWAIAVSGVVGLATAWALLRAIARKVSSFAVRVKTWFNPRNVLIQGDTDERLVDGYYN